MYCDSFGDPKFALNKHTEFFSSIFTGSESEFSIIGPELEGEHETRIITVCNNDNPNICFIILAPNSIYFTAKTVSWECNKRGNE
jgi:hypothetical protein